MTEPSNVSDTASITDTPASSQTDSVAKIKTLADLDRVLREKRAAHGIDVNSPSYRTERASMSVAEAIRRAQEKLCRPESQEERDARAAEQEAFRLQQAAERQDYRRKAYWRDSGVPKHHAENMGTVDFDAVLPQWRGIVADVIERDRWMVFVGKVGTGKTQLSCKIIHEWCQLRVTTALFVSTFDLCTEIKQGYGQERDIGSIRDRVNRVGLLVLDEYEKRFDSPSEQLELQAMFNRRYNDNLPTVVISNLRREAFDVNVGPAVADRLRQNARTVVFDWGSFRTK
jgi:DNA replication protein DnaC